jgi:GR25 family glycosyltransferase involved in LPS biosynthesis/glycosyltransferase involved in cell wall biosynthesis
MKFNAHFPAVYPICITLRKRPRKKKRMIKHAKQNKFKTNFFVADLHKNPKRGCMESHLTVIRNAIRDGHKYLFVMEDDALFIRPLKNLPAPPKNWAMLYLGGTVKHVFAREQQEEVIKKGKNVWIRMTCWTTHAYILNLQNKELIQDILNAEKCDQDMEIDRYYVDFIHQKYPCYMVHPMVCIQHSGYSDIEEKKVEYSFMQNSLYGLRRPPHEITADGSYRLKMVDIPPDLLPGVTIITPTKDREWIFSLPKFNFKRFVYPPNKMEWIIVDSSKTDDLKYQFDKRDVRIKYLHVPDCTIAHKRNLACKIASYSIIAHMDDDDYYPPESLLARVKSIVGYRNTDCVGCSRIGVYNILDDKSFISSDGHISLSEASMAYTKKFWEEQEFDPGCQRGEYRSFMQNRLDKIMDLPYIFVICATNHGRNFTPRMEWLNQQDPGKEQIRNSGTGEVMNYPDTWDDEAKLFMKNLRKYILNSRWMNQRNSTNEEVAEVEEVEEVEEVRVVEETKDNEPNPEDHAVESIQNNESEKQEEDTTSPDKK